MSEFSNIWETASIKSKSCSRIVWKPLIWLAIVIVLIVFVTGLFHSKDSVQSHGTYIDVQDGNVVDIDESTIEGFQEMNATVPPRTYPLKQKQFFQLRARQNVPFVIILPGFPGECDFDGKIMTLQDADLIVMRESEVYQPVKWPGQCNKKKLFQLVATRPGIFKWNAFYYHRSGHTEYVFTIQVK